MKSLLPMVTVVCIATTPVISSLAKAQGFFSKLKDKAETVLVKEVEARLEAEASGEQEDGGQPETPAQSQASPTAEKASGGAEAAASGPGHDVHGQWYGRLNAPKIQNPLGSAGLDILLSEEISIARVEYLNLRCLAELTAAEEPGVYQAEIVEGGRCGTSAHIRITGKDSLEVSWQDAPDMPATAIPGTLEPRTPARSRKHWSAGAALRRANDVVGFYPGMTYGQAIDVMQSQHGDLKRRVNFVSDKGSAAIVNFLSRKGRAVFNDRDPGEQIQLGFEAQTDAELDAGQPRGADGELMYIARHIPFPDEKAPAGQVLIDALKGKYGSPSVEKVTPDYQAEMQWVYDLDGEKVTDASNTPCDHVNAASKSVLVQNYRAGARARVFHPAVTVDPACGFTVKALVRMDKGQAWYMRTLAYDQQRLLADQWYALKKFSEALVREAREGRAAAEAIEPPDL